MKRFGKSMLGVTLLEILLVLAIAAMIIVMSVRYYQSASQSSQGNSFVQQISNITAAVESLSANGGYGTNITQTKLESIVGETNLIPPWGGTKMTITGTANGYTLTIPTAPTAAVCTLITARLEANKTYKVPENCPSVQYSATGVFP